MIFQWLVVDVPSRRRRQATYEISKNTFQTLLVSGPGLLSLYQKAARLLHEDLDEWDQRSLSRLSKQMAAHDPQAFGPQRAGMVRTVIDVAVPRALSELAASASYLDLDVAHALSQFPRQDGLNMLQLQPDGRGGVLPHSDVHITWSLLEANRRLYSALLATGAYGPEIFEGSVDDQPLSADVLAVRRKS